MFTVQTNMDKTHSPRNESESDTGQKVQPDDVEMEESTKHSDGTAQSETEKSTEESAAGCNVTTAETHKEEEMNRDRNVELIQEQRSDILNLNSAVIATESGINTESTKKGQPVANVHQDSQAEGITSQPRRVSKRKPKPKIIYSCNYCGQEFRDKAPLDVHVQRYHTKDTPYTCEYSCMHVSLRTLFHMSIV